MDNPTTISVSKTKTKNTYLKRNYFFWTSVFMLVLSIVAFSDNLFFDVGQKSNSDPKFIIHGLFFLAWFIVLVIQSGYISNKNYKAHRALGITGMLIGLGVVISTFYVFVAVYKGWSVMPDYVKANRLLTSSFALLIWLAYKYRNHGIKHKRLLLIGTLYVLGPVIDRVPGKFGMDSETHLVIFELIIWNSLFISLFVYDWMTLKKIHVISWVGFVWFYAIWIFVSMV